MKKQLAVVALVCAAADAQEFDIVVYGGSPGGIAAALAAARAGRSVALAEYHHHFGGMAASGLGKSDIRELSRAFELPTWDKPAMACLSSRFPYGTPITAEKLRQVDRAEAAVRALGFRNFRVRHHGEIARLEIAREEMPRLWEDGRADAIAERLGELGFIHVTLDLRGFRSGSLNEALLRLRARRAGLPLASTTYYFSSLDDLIAKAVEHAGAREAEHLRSRVATLSRRRRGAESTADVLVDLLVGEANGLRVTEQLISRYERYIACARQPGLRDIERRILQQRTDAVVEVVERSGRAVRAELLTALVCAVDGAVVAALVGDGDGPRATARATLIDVIDVLAPIDEKVAPV